MKILGIIVGLLILGGAAFWYYISSCANDSCRIFEWQRIEAADSFMRCVELGFPVMESYPRQCNAGEKHFIEEPDIVEVPITMPVVYDDKIVINEPLSNTLVSSPLRISGKARGPWYFEASFPVMVLDAQGEKLGVIPAQADGEWMTEEYVPFAGEVTFTKATTATGTVVFMKDNPSGLPEHEDSVSIPVRFR